ncbi:DUF2177 family protein [Gammaproteobacteria bacterium]|nr:DUF2177 family protein [Gammaproteobacteria bacterium]
MLLKKIIIAIFTFIILDGLWLGVIAKSLYQDNLRLFLNISHGELSVNWVSAFFVYILLIAGILIFPVEKAGDDLKNSLLWGFLFGIFVYGTYGFTNHALVQNWPLKISIIDTIWGGVLCALTTYSVNLSARYL